MKLNENETLKKKLKLNKVVVIVDDDEHVLLTMQGQLETLGFKCSGFSSAQ